MFGASPSYVGSVRTEYTPHGRLPKPRHSNPRYQIWSGRSGPCVLSLAAVPFSFHPSMKPLGSCKVISCQHSIRVFPPKIAQGPSKVPISSICCLRIGALHSREEVATSTCEPSTSKTYLIRHRLWKVFRYWAMELLTMGNLEKSISHSSKFISSGNLWY